MVPCHNWDSNYYQNTNSHSPFEFNIYLYIDISDMSSLGTLFLLHISYAAIYIFFCESYGSQQLFQMTMVQ